MDLVFKTNNIMKKGAHYFRLLTKEEQQRMIQDIGSDNLFLGNEFEYKSFESYIFHIYNMNFDFYNNLIAKYDYREPNK